MAAPVTEQDLIDLGMAINDRLNKQDAAITSLVKSFLKFRTETRDNFRITDEGFENVGKEFEEFAKAINELGGGEYLAVIEPEPEKAAATEGDEPPPKKVIH